MYNNFHILSVDISKGVKGSVAVIRASNAGIILNTTHISSGIDTSIQLVRQGIEITCTYFNFTASYIVFR